MVGEHRADSSGSLLSWIEQWVGMHADFFVYPSVSLSVAICLSIMIDNYFYRNSQDIMMTFDKRFSFLCSFARTIWWNLGCLVCRRVLIPCASSKGFTNKKMCLFELLYVSKLEVPEEQFWFPGSRKLTVKFSLLGILTPEFPVNQCSDGCVKFVRVITKTYSETRTNAWNWLPPLSCRCLQVQSNSSCH